jgi:ribonuclease PH
VREDGRTASDLRPVEILPDFLEAADGSALVVMGGTRVLCTASVEEEVPRWRERGLGWVTAEYGMLPASTGRRRQRDVARGRPDGRTTEIQRLIGRSVRAVVDMAALGERTVWLDCDVLQADGGTRCASICGAWVALARAVRGLPEGALAADPLREPVSAVSVGIVGGEPMLDLAYVEDSTAEVDCNVVMAGSGTLIEVQATGEGSTYSREELTLMLDLAAAGIDTLRGLQIEAAA